MKPYTGFEAKKTGSREHLPAGGYVDKIMKAEEIAYDWGRVLLLSVDVAEGEQREFFAKDYKAQDGEDRKWRGTYRLNIPKDDGTEKDGWTKRTFGNAMWAIEASNPGYHWDWNEAALKGKLVGALYRNKEWEYDGKTGWTTECCALTDVDSIRSNSFKMPKDKPLAKKGFDGLPNFAVLADEDVDDLPF